MTKERVASDLDQFDFCSVTALPPNSRVFPRGFNLDLLNPLLNPSVSFMLGETKYPVSKMFQLHVYM